MKLETAVNLRKTLYETGKLGTAISVFFMLAGVVSIWFVVPGITAALFIFFFVSIAPSLICLEVANKLSDYITALKEEANDNQAV